MKGQELGWGSRRKGSQPRSHQLASHAVGFVPSVFVLYARCFFSDISKSFWPCSNRQIFWSIIFTVRNLFPTFRGRGEPVTPLKYGHEEYMIMSSTSAWSGSPLTVGFEAARGERTPLQFIALPHDDSLMSCGRLDVL